MFQRGFVRVDETLSKDAWDGIRRAIMRFVKGFTSVLNHETLNSKTLKPQSASKTQSQKYFEVNP